ncbi:hypothetical protein N312_03276, partial [Balearica regulorum gibbericeps]
LLHVMLHPLLLLLLLLLGIPDALGLLKLVVVGHSWPQCWSCSLLLLLLLVALLLNHLVPSHQEIHPGFGLLRLLLRLWLGHAGPLHSRLHGVHVLHGWVGVHPSLLPLHGLLRLGGHPLGVLGPCVLGGPLLDES